MEQVDTPLQPVMKLEFIHVASLAVLQQVVKGDDSTHESYKSTSSNGASSKRTSSNGASSKRTSSKHGIEKASAPALKARE